MKIKSIISLLHVELIRKTNMDNLQRNYTLSQTSYGQNQWQGITLLLEKVSLRM